MSTQLDPMAAAVQDAETAGIMFGRLEVSAQFVVLRKGERKAIWNEGDNSDGRQTEVTFRLNPLDCSGLTRMIERQILSNSREWSAIVWGSIRDLGYKALPELNGKWAKVAMVKSGRKWNNKEGEEVEGTTFKFLEIYNSEADAIKGWEAQFGGTQAHTPTSTPTNGNGFVQNSEAEKNTAAQFLPALVKGAGGDLAKLATILASMQPVNRYFTVDSPEVQALLLQAA